MVGAVQPLAVLVVCSIMELTAASIICHSCAALTELHAWIHNTRRMCGLLHDNACLCLCVNVFVCACVFVCMFVCVRLSLTHSLTHCLALCTLTFCGTRCTGKVAYAVSVGAIGLLMCIGLIVYLKFQGKPSEGVWKVITIIQALWWFVAACYLTFKVFPVTGNGYLFYFTPTLTPHLPKTCFYHSKARHCVCTEFGWLQVLLSLGWCLRSMLHGCGGIWQSSDRVSRVCKICRHGGNDQSHVLRAAW